MTIANHDFTRDTKVPLGRSSTGPLELDLGKLMSGRCLIQGSSGAGKSHTLRRIIEEAFDYLTTIIIDPEGEFANLATHIGATTVIAREYAMMVSQRSRCERGSIVSPSISTLPIWSPIIASRKRRPSLRAFSRHPANIGATLCWYVSTRRICSRRIWQPRPATRRPAVWASPP